MINHLCASFNKWDPPLWQLARSFPVTGVRCVLRSILTFLSLCAPALGSPSLWAVCGASVISFPWVLFATGAKRKLHPERTQEAHSTEWSSERCPGPWEDERQPNSPWGLTNTPTRANMPPFSPRVPDPLWENGREPHTTCTPLPTTPPSLRPSQAHSKEEASVAPGCPGELTAAWILAPKSVQHPAGTR